ncbi:MAG: hypothetical protein ACFFD4_34680 [Candidatus Odinarchaeota archaeon]
MIMANILGIPDPDFALLVLITEILLVSVLLTGWYFGARRLNLDVHHGAVYGAISIQVLIVGTWMLPRFLRAASFVLSDIIGRLPVVLHVICGTLTVINGLFLTILFLIRRDIPLKILRRARPFMITELIVWTITLALGTLNFVNRYG